MKVLIFQGREYQKHLHMITDDSLKPCMGFHRTFVQLAMQDSINRFLGHLLH